MRPITGVIVVIAVAIMVGNTSTQFECLAQSDHSLANSVASVDSAEGAMSEGQSLRLSHISEVVQKNGCISDSDLGWVLRLLWSSPPRDTPSVRDMLHSEVLFHLWLVKSYTPSQEHSLYRSCVRLCRSQSRIDKVWGARMLGRLSDTRGVPILRKLREDPDPAVADTARKAIAEVQSRQHHRTRVRRGT
jgi:hypothetical protein